MDFGEQSLALHKTHRGKLAVVNKVPLKTRDDLSTAYTPGVAQPCLAIAKNKSAVYDYTPKGNMVAVVSDGSRVLGLGNIGPEAAIPVMEGKAILFKEFADIDAFPICLATQNVDEIVETVKRIAPVFGGINLEDIEVPKCFEVERRLQEALDIPVMHDDQHGTAVIALAGLLNALKVVNKKISEVFIAFSGAGAACLAIAHLLKEAGARNMVLCDRAGVIYKGRTEDMNPYKAAFAVETTKRTLTEAMQGADVFIGASGPGLVTPEMVSGMNHDAIVFALANPVPEIMPDLAKKGGARIAATGRSDFPNQLNNTLAFPGIFRGALDARAKKITQKMLLAAAYALAGMVEKPKDDYIIPSALDKNVAKVMGEAVKVAAG